MSKRVFIIHAWDAHPEDGWYHGIGTELRERGFEVFIPQMPNTEAPTIHTWVDRLTKVVGEPDDQTYFIGHSIGCQAILRYLTTLLDAHVASVICVAGWFSLQGLESEDERKIAEPWLTTPIDLNRARNSTTELVAIFSDNDQYVPYESNKEIFQETLSATICVVHGMGHFTESVPLPPIVEFITR